MVHIYQMDQHCSIFMEIHHFLKYNLRQLSLNMNNVGEDFAPYLLLKMQCVYFIIVQRPFESTKSTKVEPNNF